LTKAPQIKQIKAPVLLNPLDGEVEASPFRKSQPISVSSPRASSVVAVTVSFGNKNIDAPETQPNYSLKSFEAYLSH
jgi:hypothetical protein